MSKITLFVMQGCPYCCQALTYLSTIQPKYPEVEIEIIDENIEVELANSYDYYYVPTFYLGKEKLSEGAVTQSKVEEIFRRAAQQ